MNKGDLMPIYLDWQSNERLLGEAVLVEKIKDGYTFIIDSTWNSDYSEETLKIPESLVSVYSYERWLVQFKSLSELGAQHIKINDLRHHNIRYLYNIGLTKSTIAREDEYESPDRLKDSFIIVNGIEVF